MRTRIEWTILSFRTCLIQQRRWYAEGIEETADTAEQDMEENVSDSGTAGETDDSVPADDASVTTDEETQTAEESPADNETLEEAKEKETHSVEVIINGTGSR